MIRLFILIACVTIGCQQNKEPPKQRQVQATRMDCVGFEVISEKELFASKGSWKRYKVGRATHNGEFSHYKIVRSNYTIDACEYDSFSYELLEKKPDDMNFAWMYEWNRDGTLKITVVKVTNSKESK